MKQTGPKGVNIRFSGFGGQGIVLAGTIYGAAAIRQGLNAIQSQSYGSASRGGASKADVSIHSGEIYELELSKLDVLISLSQPAFELYVNHVKPDGLLIVDTDLVDTSQVKDRKVRGLPATDLAHKVIGRRIVLNIIILGYLSAFVEEVSAETLRATIRQYVPRGTEEMNLKAFEEGRKRGLADLRG